MPLLNNLLSQGFLMSPLSDKHHVHIDKSLNQNEITKTGAIFHNNLSKLASKDVALSEQKSKPTHFNEHFRDLIKPMGITVNLEIKEETKVIAPFISLSKLGFLILGKFKSELKQLDHPKVPKTSKKSKNTKD
jgi:hypothetical protein